MGTNRKRGFSMVEIMIVLAVSAVFFLIAFSTVMATINVADIETTITDMDSEANRMMQEATSILAPSFLPIKREGGTLTSFQTDVINDSDKGFGANGGAWLTNLRNGIDFVPFATIVDRDGSGDGLDGDLLPYLGVLRADGSNINSYGTRLNLSVDNYDGNYKLTGNIDAGLARLKYNDVASIARDRDFADKLAAAIGAGNPNAFGIIRFAPLYDAGGAIRMLKEADVNLDLNEDGDKTDTFMVGGLEVVYPEGNSKGAFNRVTFNLAGPMILVNNDGSAPIFQLVRFENASAQGTAGHGQYALRIRLLLCDIDTQQAKMFTAGAINAIPRYYETVVVLRNMSR